MLIYSKSRVYFLKDGYPAGLSASRSAGFPTWGVLIGRTGLNESSLITDRTLSLRCRAPDIIRINSSMVT